MMRLTGLVGWRGMVGSVLMDRMRRMRHFEGLDDPSVFFSPADTQLGAPQPVSAGGRSIDDAATSPMTSRTLKRCEIIITAQGGDYTSDVFPRLRAAGWNGHWIDAPRRCA